MSTHCDTDLGKLPLLLKLRSLFPSTCSQHPSQKLHCNPIARPFAKLTPRDVTRDLDNEPMTTGVT